MWPKDQPLTDVSILWKMEVLKKRDSLTGEN